MPFSFTGLPMKLWRLRVIFMPLEEMMAAQALALLKDMILGITNGC